MAFLNESRSTFPRALDNFNELYDLSHDMVNKANRMTELKMKASLSNDEQNELLALTAELRDYQLTPEVWNKMGSAIYALQKFFNEQVKDYITERQRIWDGYVKQFTYVGEWTSGKAYKFQNLVTASNGDLYLCKKDHTSVVGSDPLRNSELWEQSSKRGKQGDPGINLAFKGEWNPTTNYNVGDAVIYINGVNGGVMYYAIKANRDKNPTTSSTDWYLFTRLSVGRREPVGTTSGLHFIEVLD
ncbi:hypothetical protein JXA27_06880 [Aerococcaceae bacterium zg-B36]|uniref:hypothetical protein n=1 Tax=Aerococcaceae bacterium zg-252 TaxID=2796928 RepID=UPI001BD83D1A|nr:hypothetical protein [Aerococcaceae bacterium zg-B36]